jgi:serine/threonine protein kinase/tetratricopeptide (TPR) repeat protein/WD40 repeat protein
MDPASLDHDPLAPLADDFLARHRGGDGPSPEEYAARHPEFAAQILDLFPALLVVENLGGTVAGPLRPEPTAGPHPQRLGDYRILRQVGRGGMGVVYEAVQESLGRHVALKVLGHTLAGHGTYLERFRREAKAVARLHHTNIVPVFGVGEADGTHYYAMQFIHGQALDKVLADVRKLAARPSPSAAHTHSLAHSLLTGGYVPPEPEAPAIPVVSGSAASHVLSGGRPRYAHEVARLGVQAADALAYAHAQGVLHRDIKPANLLLDLHGILWVTDFGLAKADDSDDLTHTGDLVGTLRYMAPERFRGRADARSDVYALGVTLYELLTLRPAFDETDRVRLVAQVTGTTPPRPRRLDPTIPRDLETVVLKAMALDPADRYPTAAALADDLRRVVADRPILARRQSAPERLWRWARRNPAVAGLLAAVLLVSTAGTAFTSVFAVRADAERDKAVLREQDAVTAHRDATEKLFASLVSEARASRLSRRAGQRVDTLETIRKAVALARQLDKPEETFFELRNLAVAALALPDVRVVLEREYDSNTGVLEPNLDRLARRTSDGTLIVERLTAGAELARLPGMGGLGAWQFAPDGRHLYLCGNEVGIRRWEVGGAVEHLAPPDPVRGAAGEALTLTRDGRRLLHLRCVKDAGTWAVVYDLPAGREVFRRLFPSDDESKGVYAVALSPDGRRLAGADGGYSDPSRHTLLVFDVDSGRKEREFPHPDAVFAPVWLPDGRAVACSLWNHSTVCVYDADTGEKLREFRNTCGGEPSLAASPSGQVLVARGHWWNRASLLHPHTGQFLLRTGGGAVLNVPLSDGRVAGCELTGGKLKVWAAEPSPVARTFALETSPGSITDTRRITAHPGGRLVAVGTDDGVPLLDLHTGMTIGRLPLATTLCVRFDPTTGDLFTYGLDGLLRWPVRVDAATATVGPPRLIAPAAGFDATFDLSADGTTLAVARYTSVRVQSAVGDGSRLPRTLGPCRDVRQVEVSPDGRWVRGHNHALDTVQHFDARTGAVATASEFDAAAPPAAVVVRGWGDRFELVHPPSGNRLAEVRLPDDGQLQYAALTADGAHLLFTSVDDQTAHAWDLRELRRRLDDLGLDWDTPPLPPAPPSPPGGRYAAAPLTVQLVGADLVADAAARTAVVRREAALGVWANPFDAEAHYRLGLAALTPGKPAEAVEHFTRALALRPDHEGALGRRAYANQMLGRFADAAADADRALAGGSADPFTRFVRGESLAALGRHAEAVADLSAVLALFPLDFEALDQRAGCYAALGKEAEAKADRERAAAQATPAALNRQAWQLIAPRWGPRDPKRALAYATRATATSADPNHLITLGVCQYRNGLLRDAVATLEKALAAGVGDKDAVALYALALCHHELNAPRKARRHYDRAVARHDELAADLDTPGRADLAALRTEATDRLGVNPGK